MSSFALAAYPLSADYRARLEELAGAPVDVVVLPELRRLGAARLLRRLRALDGHCFLPLEDPGSVVLLPVLELLAATTRASTIEIVDSGLVSMPVSRSRAIAKAGALGLATIDARRALREAHRELRGLLAAPRLILAPGGGRRVLYVNGNLWFGLKAGGSIAHVAGVANGFASAGYAVELASAGSVSSLDPAVAMLPVLPPTAFALPTESNVYRWNASLARQLARIEPPSFIYQRHSIGSYAGVRLARQLMRPLVLEYNGSEVWIAHHWGTPNRYEELALQAEAAGLRHAQLIVTVSAVLRDELLGRGVEPERIVFHPNGVDADRFDPARFSEAELRGARERYGIAADAVVATFVGTFGQWHGAEMLARAVALLAAGHRDRLDRSKLHVLFVGDGLRMPEVRSLLAGLSSFATLAGLVPQEEAPLHLAASDILVSPHVQNADGSPFFGSPTKLFEYMAAGKAIVASDLDQIGDVLRPDGTPVARLVPPGSPEQLAEALLELAEDPAERGRLGEAARRTALDRHTWRHHVQAILDGIASLGD